MFDGSHPLGALQDTEAACTSHDHAVQKLQASIQFARGDVAPHNAIGDAHVGWAERLSGTDAMQHLQMAMDQGYQRALHINASCAEALVGLAETHTKMGKLCSHNAHEDVQMHFARGFAAYTRALQFPTQLGSFQDRCEVRYNFACLLSLCHQQQEALQILTQLVNCQGVIVSDLSNDADFASIRMLPAFQHLIEQAHSMSQAMQT